MIFLYVCINYLHVFGADSSSDSEQERHRAAEKALNKYKKASRKSKAFAEEIDKHRRKLLKVEEKLRRHKERKVRARV